jgi:hypothetical protein
MITRQVLSLINSIKIFILCFFMYILVDCITKCKNMKKKKVKFDPDEDLNRICPYCRKPFRAKHRNMIFCCGKHTDDHYNRFQRPNKNNKPTVNNLISPVLVTESAVNFTSELKKNVEILNQFNIDPIKGTVYPIELVIKKGLNLDYVSGRGKWFNTQANAECYFLRVEKYRLTRVEFSKFLISIN